MLQWALVFLVIALIAGALGLSGVAGTASGPLARRPTAGSFAGAR